jgi:hypothetical protein
MGGLVGLDPFSDRRISDSEGRSDEASTVSNGLASTRNRRTRKTGGSDIGRLSSFGIRTKVLLGLVEGSDWQAPAPVRSEPNRDLATVDSPTSRVLRKTFRVFEQLDDVVNDIVNFAAANDAPGLEGKYPFNQLLHSFEVHYPIRFPRFTTVC